MKSKKIYFMVGILAILSGLVNAQGGQVGDSCDDACDCKFPFACHEGVCGWNCYSHSECADERERMSASCQDRTGIFGDFWVPITYVSTP